MGFPAHCPFGPVAIATPLRHDVTRKVKSPQTPMAAPDTSKAKATVQKPRCANRSVWRLPPGKPREPLSAHYQLDCDFGTPLVILWQTDGTEPLYLCEQHAQELGGAGARQARDNARRGNSVSDASHKPARPAQSTAERSLGIDQQISELGAQLESILAQSQVAISVASTIDTPLEHATLEIIGDVAMTEAQKDAAMGQIGALQEFLKQDVGQEITPLQAHKIREKLWSCPDGDTKFAEKGQQAHRAVCDTLQSAIHAAVPRSKGLQERIANLLKIKAGLENTPQENELHPVVV